MKPRLKRYAPSIIWPMMHSVTRTHRAVAGTVTSVAQYGLQMILQFALAPLVLRLAGQETLGAYAVLGQVLGYLTLVDLGFAVALSRYLAQANAFDDRSERLGQIITTGRTFLLISNVVFAAGCMAMAVTAGPAFGLSASVARQAQWALLLQAAWAVARTPLTISSIALTATQDLAFRNVVASIANALRLALTFALVWAGFGLLGLLGGNVLAEVVEGVICQRRFSRKFPRLDVTWRGADPSLFRSMLSFGSGVMLINVASRMIFFSDHLIVSGLYGAAVTSIYYTTQMPATIGWNLLMRPIDSAVPAINELVATGRQHALRGVLLRTQRIALLSAIPLAGGLLAFNAPFVSFWAGPGQYAGMPMTASLAAFAVMLCVGHTNQMFVMAGGTIRVLSIAILGEGLLNVGLSLLLARHMGMEGVMLATAIAAVPTLLVGQHLCLRQLGVGYGEFLRGAVTRPLLAGSASGLALVVAWHWVRPQRLPALIAIAVAYCVVHAVGAWFIGTTADDRELLRRMLRRRV